MQNLRRPQSTNQKIKSTDTPRGYRKIAAPGGTHTKGGQNINLGLTTGH